MPQPDTRRPPTLAPQLPPRGLHTHFHHTPPPNLMRTKKLRMERERERQDAWRAAVPYAVHSTHSITEETLPTTVFLFIPRTPPGSRAPGVQVVEVVEVVEGTVVDKRTRPLPRPHTPLQIRRESNPS